MSAENELRDLQQMYKTAIDLIEADFPESAQHLKDWIAAMETSVPCRLVIGDSLAVRDYAPEEPDEVDFEADVIHQYRAGSEYVTTVSTVGQASFREVQTPGLTDLAIVLAAGGLSINSFARKAALIPMIQWADHLIFANANSRLSESEIEALNLILTLRQFAPGASEESGPLPVIYVQKVVNSSDTEAQELFDANLSSIADAGLTVDDSFLIRDSSDENDLDEYLERNEAQARLTQYHVGRQHLKETITPVRDRSAERVDLYQEQLSYETLLNRRVELSKRIEDGKYTTDPKRALEDSLSQGRCDLASEFKTVPKNGGTLIYTDAKQVIDSTPKYKSLWKKGIDQQYDRARLGATDVLIQGFSTAINRAIKLQNETLVSLHTTTAEDLKTDLQNLGFVGLFLPATSPVEVTLPDPVEILGLDPTGLPSFGDKAARYGLLSVAGVGAPLTIWTVIKQAGAAGTAAAGAEGTVAAGTVAAGTAGTVAAGTAGTVAAGTAGTVAAGTAGTVAAGTAGTVAAGTTGTVAAGTTGIAGTAAAIITGPLGIAIVIGLGVGLTLAHLMIMAQTERGYAGEMKTNLRETLGVLAAQADQCYGRFETIWKRTLEDSVRKTLRDAKDAVDSELAHMKVVSTKTPEELKEIAEQYAEMVRQLEAILTKLETN